MESGFSLLLLKVLGHWVLAFIEMICFFFLFMVGGEKIVVKTFFLLAVDEAFRATSYDCGKSTYYKDRGMTKLS